MTRLQSHSYAQSSHTSESDPLLTKTPYLCCKLQRFQRTIPRRNAASLNIISAHSHINSFILPQCWQDSAAPDLSYGITSAMIGPITYPDSMSLTLAFGAFKCTNMNVILILLKGLFFPKQSSVLIEHSVSFPHLIACKSR